MKKINDFVLHVATVNGSGSMSANNILVKALFRMGIPVSGKNLFPSNIQGLPTWFTIRANSMGFTSRHPNYDVVVAMNIATLKQDIDSLPAGGTFIYNQDLAFDPILLRSDTKNWGIPFKDLVSNLSQSPKLKKLLTNMVYVGVLAHLLNIDRDILKKVVEDQFPGKTSIIDDNIKAIQAGWDFAESQTGWQLEVRAQTISDGNKNKILIDGNSATALGFLFGGCSFLSWYPITPSSSVTETFGHYANEYYKDSLGHNPFAIIQAEDELSAICMVLGAGWAGARAATCTSGPGMSLMAEAAGLSYFAEIPAVIWNVQRVGPSTGLPTRTLQGDLISAYSLSHGDTEHIVLLPGSPGECFEMGQIAFDLSERLQTLVIVLSDLDIGMNYWRCDEFQYPTKDFDRGKVLSAADIEKAGQFNRYKDIDQDGICYRTLPGTEHPLASYFTRGSGHDESARYSESPQVYENLLDRLKKKYDTAKEYVPTPIVDKSPSAKIGIVAYGSTDSMIPELRYTLEQKKIDSSYLRVRALPLTDDVENFIEEHNQIFVVEQNRDGQLHKLIQMKYPRLAQKLISVRSYDGLPISAQKIYSSFDWQGHSL